MITREKENKKIKGSSDNATNFVYVIINIIPKILCIENCRIYNRLFVTYPCDMTYRNIVK